MSGLAKSSPSILSASTPTWKLWGLSLARLSERDRSRVLAVTVLTVGSRPLQEPHRLQVQLLVRLLCLRGKGFYTRWPIRFKLGQKFLEGVFHGAAHGKYNRDHNLGHDTWQEPLSEVSLGRSSSGEPAMVAVKFDVASRCPERLQSVHCIIGTAVMSMTP